MDAALGGGDGDAERGGDVLVGPAFDIAQNERSSDIERKGAQLRDERGNLLSLAGLHVGGQRLDRGRVGPQPCLELGGRVERLGVEPSPPVSLERLVDGDAIEPRKGSGVSAEALEIAPRLDERVLRGLFNVPVVIEQARENSSDAALEEADEVCERGQVALAGADEERGLGFVHRGGRYQGTFR